ncbi:MAG: Crp/Fnr family transcriptional regulator [Clostridia bacterium]|nr:Crp/Fnr family transcriptional regulator [Clostridia bacterium]
MDNLKAVKQCSLFENMTDNECLEAVARLRGHSETFQKGNILRSAGEDLPYFGLVTRGIVQVFMDDINGNRIIMATVTTGGSFGESLSFLRVAEIPVSIYAAEDCEVLWLSCEGLENVPCDDRIGQLLLKQFVAMMAHRTLDMNDRIQVLSKLTLREKLLTFFSQCANKSGARTFSIPLDREQLAAYLGVNRSALSRELCRLRDEKKIEFYKNTFKIL